MGKCTGALQGLTSNLLAPTRHGGLNRPQLRRFTLCLKEASWRQPLAQADAQVTLGCCMHTRLNRRGNAPGAEADSAATPHADSRNVREAAWCLQVPLSTTASTPLHQPWLQPPHSYYPRGCAACSLTTKPETRKLQNPGTHHQGGGRGEQVDERVGAPGHLVHKPISLRSPSQSKAFRAHIAFSGRIQGFLGAAGFYRVQLKMFQCVRVLVRA